MHKTRCIIYVITVTFIVFVYKYTIANAITFTPSEQLFTDQKITTFAGLVQWLFPVALSVVALFAVFMIMRAGFTLVFSADNPSARADARTRITSAIIGLVIAFGSVLILRTINPDLISLQFNVGDPITLPEVFYQGTIFDRTPDSRGSQGTACVNPSECQAGLTCIVTRGVGTCEPISQHPTEVPGSTAGVPTETAQNATICANSPVLCPSNSRYIPDAACNPQGGGRVCPSGQACCRIIPSR